MSKASPCSLTCIFPQGLRGSYSSDLRSDMSMTPDTEGLSAVLHQLGLLRPRPLWDFGAKWQRQGTLRHIGGKHDVACAGWRRSENFLLLLAYAPFCAMYERDLLSVIPQRASRGIIECMAKILQKTQGRACLRCSFLFFPASRPDLCLAHEIPGERESRRRL